MQAGGGGLGASAVLADADADDAADALDAAVKADELVDGGAWSCERMLVGVVGPCGIGALPSQATEKPSGQAATKNQTPPRQSSLRLVTALVGAWRPPTLAANFGALPERSKLAC
jgi:hypothetical protein